MYERSEKNTKLNAEMKPLPNVKSKRTWLNEIRGTT